MDTLFVHLRAAPNPKKQMKLYIIAGEASGDLHGSNLIKALKIKDADLDIHCWGGELMENAGATLVKHYRDLAFMGFAEVIANLGTILKNIKFCKENIEEFAPDALVLIDYPGFNMRIAEWAHERGIKVFYYISPQIWAWKQNRVHKIKRVVDRMHVILPFEKPFYDKFDYDVEFVGHPLLDEIVGETNSDKDKAESFRKEFSLDDRPIITLAPGSRKQEISRMLPVMNEVAKRFPDYQFVIAGAPSQLVEFYQEFADSDLKIIHGRTYDLFQHSIAGLVTSGTATLEAALFRLPQVVCYKAGWISYWIARQLVKLKYISLVNLIMDQQIVTELIQHDMNADRVESELKAILSEKVQLKMKQDYDQLHTLLGGPGASERTAASMLKILHSN
jgi:lipid-A-disaccharide synthase